LVGTRSGETYGLGDPVKVRLLEAAPLTGGLRFSIEEHQAMRPAAKGRKEKTHPERRSREERRKPPRTRRRRN
jgi:ribonuclease R